MQNDPDVQAIEHIIGAVKADSVDALLEETAAARDAIRELELVKLKELEDTARNARLGEELREDLRKVVYGDQAAAIVAEGARRPIRDQPQA